MATTSSIRATAALRYRSFRLFLAARFASLSSHQLLAVAMAQYVYERTRDPLALGYIGLALFLPKLAFTLIAGHAADRYDRKTVLLWTIVVQFLATGVLIISLLYPATPLLLLYGILFLMGTANTFGGPASQSIVPQLVADDHFSNAVAWNSSVMQVAFVIAPAAAGFIYAGGGVLAVLAVVALFRLIALLALLPMQLHQAQVREATAFSWHTVLAGIRYIRKERLILGIISLDLFAVLFGGVVALLPIFANDILKVGPSGLGILRAAPSIGAALMAVLFAHLPPLRRTGRTLLGCVAIFGLATILFGLSRHFMLSLLLLFILGAADMVSVVIRGVLVQLKTPPEMRGRVSAVNLIFIGASNELGEFESGLTAGWFGTVPAVIIGGVGTLVVVALWARRFPEIRKYGALQEKPS